MRTPSLPVSSSPRLPVCLPLAVVLLLCPMLVPTAVAQNAPHLAYLYPAGGQAGTVLLVKAGGQFLSNVSRVYVSGGGIEAQAVDYARPMTPMQATQLREKVKELQTQPPSPEVQKQIVEIRQMLARFNRNVNPVLAETAILQIKLDSRALSGPHELRVATPQGLSNPIVFMVGELAEFEEKQAEAGVLMPGINQEEVDAAYAEMRITVPVTVNGRIVPRAARTPGQARPGQQFTPGDADRYRFEARQGQNLVVSVSARELIPYLADAVPGWFQPAVTLFDDKGTELAYDDDYRFHPDPVLHYVIPKDGEYVVEIKDALYRGREDFVYRFSVGELPFVTSIFPLGGQLGVGIALARSGWNLASGKADVMIQNKRPGIYPVPMGGEGSIFNAVLFAVDTLPEGLEKEPDNDPKSAQRIKLPVIVNGRVDQPGDWDVFSFEGRAGDQVVAEVLARRLDSPLDSVLKLTDAAGRQVAFNDDHEDKGSGLLTHHADSLVSATLPAAGVYYLHLGDAQRGGGAEYAYRLRVSAPRPDFELRVTPSSINAGAGMTVPITVHALRKDGFSGAIALALNAAPRGFVLSGAVVPAGQDRVRLTLTVPPVAIPEPISLSLEGRATILGREVTREAVPAEDMMQAFAYRHLVPAQDLKVAMARRAGMRAPARILGDQPVRIPIGGTARVRAQVQLPPNVGLDKPLFELSEPPEGIEIQEVTPLEGGAEIVLRCDAAKGKAGLGGNLIFNVSAERQVTPPNGGAPQARRIPLGALPAVPFEIVQ